MFGLPSLYWSSTSEAYSLLRGHVAVDDVVSDLAAFEVWRYAFVMAVGLGSWDWICELLEALGSLWPGAACWVIDQAISVRTARSRQMPLRKISQTPSIAPGDCEERYRR